MSLRIVIAAGGTGGHLIPGVAVGRELRRRGHRVHFILKSDEKSQAFLAREGFASTAFAYEGFPRGLSPRLLLFPLISAAALLNARRALEREKPDAVLGMGGYISVPVGLAAAFRGAPLVIHEQNRRAGLANRLLSRFASAAALSFPETEGLSGRAPQTVTGLPLRAEIAPGDPAAARRKLGLDERRFTVLFFGGSQGARALNRLAAAALEKLAPFRERWQFVHLTGAGDGDATAAAYRAGGWKVFAAPYSDDMAAAYAAADFVVSRSGANTVMELARLGKRALLVPFPYATDDHQRANARYLEELGQARVVLEKDLTADGLSTILVEASKSSAPAAPPAAAAETLAGAPAKLADLLERAGGRTS